MRDVRLRDYLPGDVLLLRARPESARDLGMTANDFDGGTTPEGIARTVTRGHEVILCAGICPIWRGRRYLAWVIAGEMSRAEWGFAVKAMRAALDGHAAPRIEADCRADWPTGVRFLERLGFEAEGIMVRYDGEHDFARLSRPGGQYRGKVAA